MSLVYHLLFSRINLLFWQPKEALKPIPHILFWSVCGLFLVLFYGSRNNSIEITLWFVAALLPITVLTTYAFNYYLIPRFLIPQRYLKFGLYALYTVVLSAYLQGWMMLLVFVFIAELNIDVAEFDTVFLLAGMYLPVLLGVSIKLFKIWQSELAARTAIEKEKAEIENRIPPEEETISLRANRKNHRIAPSAILYVEGLKDYVKVHLEEGKPLIVKETLSGMEKRLTPFQFTRIHKSFLVSIQKISSFESTAVEIAGREIPVGRSFRKGFLERMEGR
jgi:two-component system response regulator LytT